MKNCPFYGASMHMDAEGGVYLLTQTGNRCALLTEAPTPCVLEVQRRAVEWRQCMRVAAFRVNAPPAAPPRQREPGED